MNANDKRSLQRLSNEILTIVVQYLDTRSIKMVGTTCIRLREVAEMELWKSLTVVFQQLPLTRTTRLRVERAKTVYFCTFCRNPGNRRLLERVKLLRLSVPTDIEATNDTGTRFETDMAWFVNNISTLFPKLNNMEVYSECGSLASSRAIINPLLAHPVAKRVEIKVPKGSLLYPSVGRIENCQHLTFEYPVSVEAEKLMTLDVLQDVESLHAACEDHMNRTAIEANFMCKSLLESKIKRLKLSRIVVHDASVCDWLPPQLESIWFEDSGLRFRPEVEPVKVPTVTHLGLTGQLDVTGVDVFGAFAFPNLTRLTTNGNFDFLYPDLPKLDHVTFTGGSIEKARGLLLTVTTKSFEMFIGRVGEQTLSQINLLATCAKKLETIIITIIPSFDIDPRTNAFGQTLDSGYRTFISIVRVFLQNCPNSDLHLRDPEGLEYVGMSEGWLVPKTAAVGSLFRVDYAAFKERHRESSAHGSMTVSYS